VLYSSRPINLGKFDAKSDKGIFLGYSSTSRACKVFRKRTATVMESINVVIDDEVIGSSNEGEHLQSIDAPLDPSSTATV
jgi:hypothetical protein